MPPKASNRRSARVSSREPETSRERPGQFVRPHLPSLSGTPSSRRQYSYGSALEPPRRPAAGSQRIDISNAVSEALTRRPGDLDDGAFVRPQKPQPQSTTNGSHEEEGAHGARLTNRVTRSQPQDSNTDTQLPNGTLTTGDRYLQSLIGGSDLDSLRSFGMESDYYGDATIDSTPGNTPAPDSRHTARAPAPSLETVPERESPARQRAASGVAANSRPVRNVVDQPVGRTREQQQSDQRIYGEEPREEDEDEEYDPADPRLGHQRFTNTPAIKRMAPANGRQLRPRNSTQAETYDEEHSESESEHSSALEQDSESFEDDDSDVQGSAHMALPRNVRTLSSLAESPRRRKPRPADERLSLHLNAGPTQTELYLSPERIERQLKEQQRKERLQREEQRRNSKSPQSKSRRGAQKQGHLLGGPFLSPYDRDAAIQREIYEAEEEAERELREREGSVRRREYWRKKWNWLVSLLSVEFIRRRLRENERLRDEAEDLGADEDVFTNWWQLLNPLTYITSIIWVLDKVMDRFIDFIDQISLPAGFGRIPRPGPRFRQAVMALFVLLMAFIIWPLISFPSFTPPSIPVPTFSRPNMPHVEIPDLGDAADKVGSMMPAKPSFSLPKPSFSLPISFPSWGSSKAEDDDDDDETIPWTHGDPKDEISQSYMKKYEKEIKSLKKSGKLHDEAIKKLETILPAFIVMDNKTGKPTISSEFYHALKELIHEDGDPLMLKKKGKQFEVASDAQWAAIVSGLLKDKMFTSSIDAQVDKKMTSGWDAWVKKNARKVQDIMKPALDKIKVAGSGPDFDKKMGKLLKDYVQDKKFKEIVVTREEFLKHVNELSTARNSEIKAEIEQLEPRIKTMIYESVKANGKDSMTRGEAQSLVSRLVSKAIGDMNLEAIVKNQIAHQWDADLKNQVNVFSVGSGASIDGKLTSPLWMPKGGAASRPYKNGIKSIYPPMPIDALRAWDDEGDCFCAARSFNRRGNPHGATLSIQLGQRVVPQHVVVEHILPGATTDPGARPKHIEVYAVIDDVETRERLRDFASVQFPDVDDWNAEKPGYEEEFVKIGQFVYESDEAMRGRFVHQLRPELLELDAETDQVVLRAVSNYGAEDHTCFYRVRLFGELRGH